MSRTKRMKRDEKKKAKKLRENQALAALVEAGAAAEGGSVGVPSATATDDVEMTTSAQEEEVSQLQADAQVEDVKDRKEKLGAKKWKKSQDTEEVLQATDDLPAPEIGARRSRKAKKNAKSKELHDSKSAKMTKVEEAMNEGLTEEVEEELFRLNHHTQETSAKKPKKTKKKSKQKEGEDTESDRTIEDDSIAEARKVEEAVKAETDHKAQEEAEEAERKRLRRNERSKEYKRKKTAEKRLEAAQKKVQDSLAATLASLGMNPRRDQWLAPIERWTYGNADAEETAVDMTDYELGMDEEWMKLLQDSAPDGEKLGDEIDTDRVDVDSDEENVIDKSGIFDDDNHVSKPMEKMNDFMKQIYSTLQDSAIFLSPTAGPSTPPEQLRPPRNLHQEAHHFSHSHPFYSDGAWIHTISDRRAYQRDVYDYLRAKGFCSRKVNLEVMAHQLKDDWMGKFGPEDYDKDSDGSAFGNMEIDDSEMIITKLRDSIKSSKRKWDQIEVSDARNNGSDEHDADGTPSTGKRRKSVTFSKDVKIDDGGRIFISRPPQVNTPNSIDEKQSASPNLNTVIEDLMEKETEGHFTEDVKIDDGGRIFISRPPQVNTPDSIDEKQSASPNLNTVIEDLMEKETEGHFTEDRDAERKRRREKRKKIQKNFKNQKAASWVSEQHAIVPENVAIAYTSMNEDIPGASPVAARRSIEASKHGTSDTSTERGLLASSCFAVPRSLEVNKGDVADTSMNEPLSFHQNLSRDYQTTIREDSTTSSSEERNEREDHEELIHPTTNLFSTSRPKDALVSPIDILSEALRANASRPGGETTTEPPKEKKRKRKSKLTDDESLALITNRDDLKEETAVVEDMENVDRKKKRKNRKSNSANDDTEDFLAPMIHQA